MGFRRVVVLLGFVVGCDGGEGGYQVTFHGAPAFVDVQDGAGAWRSLRFDNDTATATISGGYHSYAYGCFDGNTPRALRVVHDAGVPAAAIEVCPRAGALVHVSGRASPSWSYVTIGGYPAGETDVGGFFDAMVPAGTYDVAWTGVDQARGGILRDVEIAEGTDLQLFASAPPIVLPATITGLGAGDRLLVSGTVRTPRGSTLSFFNTDPAAVPLAPESVRRPGDVVSVSAAATVDQSTRTVERAVTGATLPELALPALGTLTIARTGFSADPGWGTVQATLNQPTPLGRTLSESATSDWLVATGETTVAWTDPADLPGWDPTWGLLMPGAATGSIAAYEGDLSGNRTSISTTGVSLTW